MDKFFDRGIMGTYLTYRNSAGAGIETNKQLKEPSHWIQPQHSKKQWYISSGNPSLLPLPLGVQKWSNGTSYLPIDSEYPPSIVPSLALHV